MLAHARLKLIKNAADAALVLNQNLDLLLDAYDFYVQRYEALTPSDELTLKDLQTSIAALGVLPLQVANHLDDWTRDKQPELSSQGFEVNVLNEFSIHMFAVSTFFHRKLIDLELDHPSIAMAFENLRSVNRLLAD